MRLIDADTLDNVVQVLNEKRDFGITRVDKKMIDSVLFEFPTVDAVEVVRCYECVQSEQCLKRNSVYCNKLHDAVMRNWYCADGEKRKE